MKAKFSSIAILMMAVMMVLLSSICMADEEMIVVYAEVPEDWSEPHIWAWGEDGTGAFDAWPGEKMIQDENNEGWYYMHVPKWVTSVIINGNEGTVQTSDLSTNKMSSWVSVKSPEEATLTNEKMTSGDLPQAVQMITVHAIVPDDWTMPSLWAWSSPDGTNVFANWPGQEMIENTDGWYSFEVPSWVNSVIVNGNLGSVQTSDISIEAKDVWLIIESPDSVEVSYEKPEIELSEEDMIKIHAQVPESWVMPSLWAWSSPDGTNVYPNWPGQEMIEEDGWLTMTVPKWVNSIIVNGNLGEVQTSDISIEARDVWLVVKDAENFELYYEKPVEETTEAETKEETKTEEVDVQEEPEKETSNTVYILIIAGVVILGGGFYLFNKKK